MVCYWLTVPGPELLRTMQMQLWQRPGHCLLDWESETTAYVFVAAAFSEAMGVMNTAEQEQQLLQQSATQIHCIWVSLIG